MQGLIVDSFCGLGGASQGIFYATGAHPDIAINHAYAAVEAHRANHPSTLHYLNDIWKVDPREATGGQEVRLFWGSPDCTHFSNARGGVPVASRVRDLIWVVVKWVRETRPEIVCVENVCELLSYGELMPLLDTRGRPRLGEDGKPLMVPDPAKRGQLFERWCQAVRQEGYSLDWRELCAADYGAPTTRRRLFLVARRDNARIPWPEPTHDIRGRNGLQKWVPAASVIDWSLPTQSIFTRKKALVEKSEIRLIKGLQKFVLNNGAPFIAPAPASALDHSELVLPWINRRFGGMVGRGVELPWPTITTVPTQNELVCAKLTRAPADGSLVTAFLLEYYSSGGQFCACDAPLNTIPTKDRFNLVTVTLRGQDYVVTDICTRMLTARELARAQGFPEDYILTGTRQEQLARIGNSVVPALAEAVVRVQLRPPVPKRKKAA